MSMVKYFVGFCSVFLNMSLLVLVFVFCYEVMFSFWLLVVVLLLVVFVLEFLMCFV